MQAGLGVDSEAPKPCMSCQPGSAGCGYWPEIISGLLSKLLKDHRLLSVFFGLGIAIILSDKEVKHSFCGRKLGLTISGGA